MGRCTNVALTSLAGAIAASALFAGAAQAKFTNLCVSSSGVAAKGDCHRPSFSANNRFIAFDSDADNLVAGDDNGKSDVFVRDRKKGKTELISTDPKGNTPAGVSLQADISADGRYVAFVSVAPGVVKGVKGGKRQVYLRDRKTDKTKLISVSSSGKLGGGDSDQPVVDGHGTVVAFRSDAKNLVSDDTNRTYDVFARDVRAATTTRVNTSAAGAQDKAGAGSPSISADGRLVTFDADYDTALTPGSALTEVYVKDLETNALELISQGPGGVPGDDIEDGGDISADGRYVAFSSSSTNLGPGPPGGAPYGRDVYVRDRVTQTTVRASVDASGGLTEALDYNPSISADGTKVAYIASDNHENIFVRNLVTNTTKLATPQTKDRGDDCSKRLDFLCGDVSTPRLSPDGSLLGFEAAATGYIPNDAKYITTIISG